MAYTAIPASSSGDPTLAAARAFLQGKIPQLTRFEKMVGGQYPPGAGIAAFTGSDPAIEGGAGGAPIAGAANAFGNSIYQTMKTGKWGYLARCKFQVPTAGKTNRIGFINAAASHILTFGTINATSAVNYVVSVEGAVSATTIAADASHHDFAMTSDGTTITLYVDGVSGFTAAASGLTTDEPMFWSDFNTDARVNAWDYLVYGFVGP